MDKKEGSKKKKGGERGDTGRVSGKGEEMRKKVECTVNCAFTATSLRTSTAVQLFYKVVELFTIILP